MPAHEHKILVIDDDPDILELLSYILTAEGYQIVTSADGKEADSLHEILPDLLLIDLRMHGAAQAGAKICLKLKTHADTRSLPVILISAEPDIESIAKYCYADDYISKPFNIHDFLSKIRTNLYDRKSIGGTP
ncbi:two-component system, OmpR family, phosphate regulon response regulator PhoB [Mucilaginibacter gossypiicola]|uniref:Two-component system, OmpR family, phosphate regulon response regulator PhoB n=1 Tax=Mucilaginibacter gossypiicola TaxID=551995 RepID=A0A1H8DFY8_9SPHI|nr:response regulator [Mucilaginibacter gossypiicola]SEN06209.1 two-component system, OmpR family, phosphate regulon response regulator PhoB [Mucilaginibacter gossypiicola]